MASRPTLIALVAALFLALAVSAQQPAEFGRAEGGELMLTPKGAAPLSGSLELSLSNGSDPGYGITAGGTLVQDRLWFFAAGSRQETSANRFANLALPENATASAIGARVNGQIGGGHDFSAFFEAARQPQLSMTAPPSSFLSLRYTGVVTDNLFFTTSFTRSSP